MSHLRHFLITLILLTILFLPTLPAAADTTYVVQPGDTLWKIARAFNTTIQAIVEANEIANPDLIFAGQVLLIPGASTSTQPPSSTSQPPTPTPQPLAANLLPNPSFENGSYRRDGINELEVPNNWYLETEEGYNYLDPAANNLFLRPESRVLPASNLPEAEHPLFIFDGYYTVKVFKGGAPTSFRLFTDVYLQPGTYTFAIQFFPDLVWGYAGGQKVWAYLPQAGEARFVVGSGGSEWVSVQPGVKNTLSHTFTLSAAGPIRLGAAFRNRYVLSNNGWFLDAWSLQQATNR